MGTAMGRSVFGILICMFCIGLPWGADSAEEGEQALSQTCRVLSFDGGAWVRVPHSESLDLKGPMTIEAWVRGAGSDAWTAYPNLIGKRENSTRYPTWVLGIWNDGRLYAVADEDQLGLARWRKSVGRVPTDRWTHVALVFDGEQLRFFVDGRPESVATSLGQGPSNEDAVFVGGLGSGSHCLRGYLDSVRVSTSLRYTEAFRPEMVWEPDDKTVLLLTFDEPDGSRVLDSSGYGNHGELVGVRRKLLQGDCPGRTLGESPSIGVRGERDGG